MLKIIQRFDKHCSCHLQGEYVGWAFFWKPYIGQAVGGKWDMTDLTGEVGERAAIQLVTSMCFRKRGDEKILLRARCEEKR
jgi:hypothetical protein